MRVTLIAAVAALWSGSLCASCQKTAGDGPAAGDAGMEASAVDAGFDATPGDGADALTIDLAADGGVLSIALPPLTLHPAFSPDTMNYYVNCAAGGNPVTLVVTTAAGTTSVAMVLLEDQVLPVDDYWVRCLPHDFPSITVSRPGVPTPGYYLVNSNVFGAVLDGNGVPVWYARGTETVNVNSVKPNTISLMLNATDGPFGTIPTATFEVRSLATNRVADLMAVGAPTDAHELRALANGDYLLFTYPIEADVSLRGLGGYGDSVTIADCEIQEVEPTGTLVWRWLASDHIDPVRESVAPQDDRVSGMPVVDVFHCNSIDVDSAGNLLVSMRHTNAVYYVNRTTGTIEWKLGGTPFNLDGAAIVRIEGDPEKSFTLQHDARFQANGDVSVFDDHGSGTGVARGVEYSIDHATNVASFVFQYAGTAASAQEGSFRRYADGDSVIGWGYIATDPRILTEIDAQGNDVFDIAMGGAVSYRAVKVPITQFDIDVLRQTAGK